MKQIIITILFALFATTSYAQKELDTFFGKYEGKQNVEVTFISKEMLKAMAKNGKSLGKGAKQIDGLRILETENKSLVSTIKEEALNTFSNSAGYKDLMRMNDGGETTIIRQKRHISKKSGNSNKSTFVLINYSESSINVVGISGTDLELNDIQKMK